MAVKAPQPPAAARWGKSTAGSGSGVYFADRMGGAPLGAPSKGGPAVVPQDDLDLLRRVYKHLKKNGFEREQALAQGRLDALFVRLAALLKAPRPAGPALTLNTDGACRGNPGPAGAGGVLAGPDGAVLDSFALPLGRRTNNEAEYLALIEGLKRARGLGPTSLLVRSDSLLLIKQMRGEFRVKKRGLVQLHLEARRALPGCPVVFEHVPREENEAADRLAGLGVEAGSEPGAVASGPSLV
jgi:ribonuclease HI